MIIIRDVASSKKLERGGGGQSFENSRRLGPCSPGKILEHTHSDMQSGSFLRSYEEYFTNYHHIMSRIAF